MEIKTTFKSTDALAPYRGCDHQKMENENAHMPHMSRIPQSRALLLKSPLVTHTTYHTTCVV